MARFYLRRLAEVPRVLWEASDFWWRIVELGLLAGIFIPAGTEVIWEAIDQDVLWISAASFGVLVAMGLLIGNYSLFSKTDAKLRHTEARLASLGSEAPRLEFAAPSVYKDETIDSEKGVELWRVIITNEVVGTVARNVRLILSRSEPDIGLPPVDLHETRDNRDPPRRSRDLRYGEPIVFDVVAKRIGSGAIYLCRGDLTEGYAYKLSELEMQRIEKALYGNGVLLFIHCVGDPPTKLVERQHVFRVNGSEHLELTEATDPA